MSDQDQLIEQFMSVTSSSKYLAEQYLNRNKNDVVNAIEDFYANHSVSGQQTPQSSRGNKPKSGGIRTFRDLNNDDEDSDDEKTNNFFTGGEKSGLEVEDPNKKDKGQSVIDQIFQRAKEQGEQPDDRPSAQDPEQPEPKFTGSGFKLGDGNEPSQEVVDPSSSIQRPTKVTREITFWKQGFTVGDGPLHRYDDPSNANVLQELNRGRVPMSLLDVEFGQDVDVSVFKKTDEEWRQPKKRAGGYGGLGQRLGSPVPGEIITNKPAPTEPEVAQETPKPDNGHGDSLVQIRFANGKRVSQKFNSTDSIQTVYEFVRLHANNESNKPFALSHAFPVKPIEESPEITVEDAKLKNAVIVQRWL